MGQGIPQRDNFKATDWVYLDADPYGGAPSTQATPVSNFFGNIPTPVGLAGAAKVTKYAWMPASAARAPGIKPATYADHGISGAWRFADGAEEIIHANLMVPDDMDMSAASIICLGWSSTTTSQDCDWEIAYLITAVDGDTSAVAAATEQSYEESSSVAEGMVKSEFCVIAGGTIVAGDICLHVQIMRDGNDGSDNLGAAAEVHGIMLKYVANKLGT